MMRKLSARRASMMARVRRLEAALPPKKEPSHFAKAFDGLSKQERELLHFFVKRVVRDWTAVDEIALSQLNDEEKQDLGRILALLFPEAYGRMIAAREQKATAALFE